MQSSKLCKLRQNIIHFHMQNTNGNIFSSFLDGVMVWWLDKEDLFCIFNNYLWKKPYCQCIYAFINWKYSFKIQNSLCLPVVKGRCVMLFKQVRVNHVDESVAPEKRRSRISFSIPLIKSANLKRNNVLILAGFLKYSLHQWHTVIKQQYLEIFQCILLKASFYVFKNWYILCICVHDYLYVINVALWFFFYKTHKMWSLLCIY